MRRLLPSSLAIVLALAVFALLVGRFHFPAKIFALKAAIWGLPVIGVAWYLMGRFAPQRARWRHFFASVLLFLLLLVPLSFVGTFVVGWRLERARTRAEQIAALVESHRARVGQYPATIAEAERTAGPIPLPVFAPRDFYELKPNHAGFVLTLEEPRTLFGYWAYDSQSRRWVSRP